MATITTKIPCKQVGCSAMFDTKSEQKQHARLVHQQSTQITYLDNSQRVIWRSGEGYFHCSFGCDGYKTRNPQMLRKHCAGHNQLESEPKEPVSGVSGSSTARFQEKTAETIRWIPSEMHHGCIYIAAINIIICSKHRTCLGWEQLGSHLARRHGCAEGEVEKVKGVFCSLGWNMKNPVDDTEVHELPYLDVKLGIQCPKCLYCCGERDTLRKHVRKEHREFRLGRMELMQVRLQRLSPQHKYIRVVKMQSHVTELGTTLLNQFQARFGTKEIDQEASKVLLVNAEVESQWVKRTGWSKLFAGRNLKKLALNTNRVYLRFGHNGAKGLFTSPEWSLLDTAFVELWEEANEVWRGLPITLISKFRSQRSVGEGGMLHAGKIPQLVNPQSAKKYQKMWIAFLTYCIVWNDQSAWFWDTWQDHTRNAEARVAAFQEGGDYRGPEDEEGVCENMIFTWGGDLITQYVDNEWEEVVDHWLRFPFDISQAKTVKTSMTKSFRDMLDKLTNAIRHHSNNPSTYTIKRLLLDIILTASWENCLLVSNPILLCFLHFAGIDGEDGTLRTPSTYTNTLAAVTYGIRLFSLLWVDRQCGDRNREAFGDVLDFIVLTELSPTGTSVFSQIQMLLGYGMAIHKSTQSRHQMIWTKAKDALIFNGKLLPVSKIQESLRCQLENCWTVLEKEILLGEEINVSEWIEMLAGVVDDPREKMPGFWFMDGRYPLAGEGVKRLQEKRDFIVRQWLQGPRANEVVVEGGGNELRLCETWAQNFLSWVGKFFDSLSFVIHLSSGLPHRGTEILSLVYRNQQDRLRNVIILEGQVLLFADYNKTDNRTGRNKVITRMLPDEVGLLLVIFLVAIVPVRTMALEVIEGRDEQLECKHSLFSNGLKVWTTDRLTSVLQDGFLAVCDFGLGVRDWRQVAVACYREMMGVGRAVLHENNGEEEEGDTIGELQAGHSHQVSIMNYGVIGNEGLTRTVDQESLRVFREACADWHRFLDLGAESSVRMQRGMEGVKKKQVKSKPKKGLFGVVEGKPTPKKNLHDFFGGQQRQREAEWENATPEEQARLAYGLMFPKGRPGVEIFRSHVQRRLVEAMFGEIGRKDWATNPKLVIMPTGEGKSLLYQLPAFHPEARLTVVFCPYKALVDDQKKRVKAAGLGLIDKVDFIQRVQDRPTHGVVVLSYDSLRKDMVRDWLRERADSRCITKLVVDECHVVLTEWKLTISEKLPEGFRPAMGHIAFLGTLECPLLFLTATLPPHWVRSWLEAVKITADQIEIHRALTYRSNVCYEVRVNPLEDKGEMGLDTRIKWLIQYLSAEAELEEKEKGLVFFGSKSLLEDCLYLGTQAGLAVFKHHSDMTEGERKKSIKAWEERGHGWLFATKGLGAGVDFDVKRVVNLDAPDTLVEYAQQSGRCGRGGGTGIATLLVSSRWKLSGRLDMGDQLREVSLVEGCLFNRETVSQTWRYFLGGQICRRICLSTVLDGMCLACKNIPNAELCDVCRRDEVRVVRRSVGELLDAKEELEKEFSSKRELLKNKRKRRMERGEDPDEETEDEEDDDDEDDEEEEEEEQEDVEEDIFGEDFTQVEYRKVLGQTQDQFDILQACEKEEERGGVEVEYSSWDLGSWGGEGLSGVGVMEKEKGKGKGKAGQSSTTPEVIVIPSSSLVEDGGLRNGMDEVDGRAGEVGGAEWESGGEGDWQHVEEGGNERESGDGRGVRYSSFSIPSSIHAVEYNDEGRWGTIPTQSATEKSTEAGKKTLRPQFAVGERIENGRPTEEELMALWESTIASPGRGNNNQRRVRSASVLLSPPSRQNGELVRKRIRSGTKTANATVTSSALNQFLDELTPLGEGNRMPWVGGEGLRGAAVEDGKAEGTKARQMMLWASRNCLWCRLEGRMGGEHATWDCFEGQASTTKGLFPAKKQIVLRPGQICFTCLLNQQTCNRWSGKGRPDSTVPCIGEGVERRVVVDVSAAGWHWMAAEYNSSAWGVNSAIPLEFVGKGVGEEYWKAFVCWGQVVNGSTGWNQLNFQGMLSFMWTLMKNSGMV